MGWDFLGFPIPTARKVLVFQFENTWRTEQVRLRRMLSGMSIVGMPDSLFYSDPTIRVNLGTERDKKTALEVVKQSGADVVIYDPLTSLHQVNENDNVAIRKVLDTITEMNRTLGTTAIVIHHFGKPVEGQETANRTRGASSIRDWADTLIALTARETP